MRYTCCLVFLLIGTLAAGEAGLTEEARLRIIDKGLAHLASTQRPDGSIGQGAGLTALAGMAFLAGGHTPASGKYRAESKACLEYVLQAQDALNGYLGATYGNMYAHGFATLYLAEIYGMSPDIRVRRALEAALDLIYRSQNRAGGWRYQPVPTDADISITICQVMALRAAYNIGIGGRPSEEAMSRAVGYVRRCIGPNGVTSYTDTQGGGGHASIDGVPRAAAAAMSLIGAGITDPKDHSFGPVMKFLRRFVLGHVKSTSHWYWYGQYYASQAMFHSPEEADWESYRETAFPIIANFQDENGHWSRPDNQGGSLASSIALIILQIPNNYLPIFQR